MHFLKAPPGTEPEQLLCVSCADLWTDSGHAPLSLRVQHAAVNVRPVPGSALRQGHPPGPGPGPGPQGPRQASAQGHGYQPEGPRYGQAQHAYAQGQMPGPGSGQGRGANEQGWPQILTPAQGQGYSAQPGYMRQGQWTGPPGPEMLMPLPPQQQQHMYRVRISLSRLAPPSLSEFLSGRQRSPSQ